MLSDGDGVFTCIETQSPFIGQHTLSEREKFQPHQILFIVKSEFLGYNV